MDGIVPSASSSHFKSLFAHVKMVARGARLVAFFLLADGDEDYDGNMLVQSVW